MADFERQLKELEDALENTESEVQHAQMPEHVKAVGKPTYYLYATAGLTPVLVAGIFYYLKPRFITKRGKKLDMSKLVKMTAIITLIVWACLYALYYFKFRG